MSLSRGSKEPLFHLSRAPSDLSFRPRQDDSRSEPSCGNGTCFSVQEGLFEPSPHSVILSEVVVAKRTTTQSKDLAFLPASNGVSGRSHRAVCIMRMLLYARDHASVPGVLRLCNCFAERSSYSAQDDTGFFGRTVEQGTSSKPAPSADSGHADSRFGNYKCLLSWACARRRYVQH